MKDQLKKIRADLDAALADILTKNGLRELRSGNCTFTPDGSFVFKVEGVAAGGSSKDEQLYDILAAQEPELWPKRGTPAATIQIGGRACELFGSNTTLSKIKYRDPDGKAWLTPTEAVRGLILRARAIASGTAKVPPPRRGGAAS